MLVRWVINNLTCLIYGHADIITGYQMRSDHPKFGWVHWHYTICGRCRKLLTEKVDKVADKSEVLIYKALKS